MQGHLLRSQLLAIATACFVAIPAAAQTGAVQGSVRSETGAPVNGASVQVEGTAIGTITASDGSFRISGVPAGERLIVARSVGYREGRVPVLVDASGTSDLTITLQSTALQLDQLVVTGTRSERELRDVPAAISIVGGAEFDRRGAVYQGQELVGVPGVTFESGYEGTYAAVQIRGISSEHHNDSFIALVDGVPFATNSDEADLERLLPLSVIERVEVVRGPMSALYGRGGVSGAVNYITRDAFSAPVADVRVDGGSYGYLRPQATVSAPLGARNRLLAHAFHERKDGWREGTDRDAWGVFVKNQWVPGERTTVETWFNHNTSSQAFASHLPVTADGTILSIAGGPSANHQIEDPFDDRTLSVATGTVDHAFTDNLSVRATVQFRDVLYQTNIGFVDAYDATSGIFSWSGYGAESDYDVLFAEPQLSWRGERVLVVAGGSVERLSGRSKAIWTGQYGFTPGVGFLFYAQRKDTRTGQWLGRDSWVSDTRTDVGYTNLVLGGYAQAEWDVTDRAMFTVGARFDRFGKDADFAEVAPRGTPIPASSREETNQRVTPKLSFSWRWSPALTTYASYGEGFSPAFGLISGFASRSDDLKPEIARSYEVGAKGSAWEERLGFSVALFHMDRRDMIVQMFGTGEERIRFTNAGGQHSRGVELGTFPMHGPSPSGTTIGSWTSSPRRSSTSRGRPFRRCRRISSPCGWDMTLRAPSPWGYRTTTGATTGWTVRTR